MGFFTDISKLAGEAVRIKKDENKLESLDPKTKQWIEEIIQRANNGDTYAMFELGGYFFSGEYVGYSPEQACYWWTEAANRGNINAQYNLGLLYHGSISTYFYDENLAGYWFNLAAINGDQEAYNMLNHYHYSKLRNKWTRR